MKSNRRMPTFGLFRPKNLSKKLYDTKDSRKTHKNAIELRPLHYEYNKKALFKTEMAKS